MTMVIKHTLAAEIMSANISCDFITHTYFVNANVLNVICFKLDIE